jgi:hypothetical protein
MKRWLIALIALGLAGCIYMPVHGDQGDWKVIQKSSSSVEIVPAGKRIRGHEIEVWDGDTFLLDCFIADRETFGWCGHKKIYMKWKVERNQNWLNPSTEEVHP